MASLSLDMRRAIAFRAATVYQRVATARQHDAPAPAESTIPGLAALRAWNQAFSPGDREAFQRRLSWDGLDWHSVGRALAIDAQDAACAPAWFQLSPESDWTVWLDGILDHAGRLVAELDAGVPTEVDFFEHGAPPFVELVSPAFRTAKEFLKQLHPDVASSVQPEVQRALGQQLLKELAFFSERAFFDLFQQVTKTDGSVAEGSSGMPARYAAFVRSMLVDGLPTFYLTYPVLARITAMVLERWVQYVGELFERLRADRDAIAARLGDGTDPGDIVAIRPGLSDPHHGRRRVALLTFATGLQLIYKPRDIGLERELASFLMRANDAGLDPPQHVLRMIERPGYGWVECAEQEAFSTRDEVRGYFRRAGGLVCIAHLLRATDLHMENIVATRHGPVVIDAESFLQPARDFAQDSVPGVVRRVISEPCVATGLVTFAETGANRARYETGGLRGEGLRGSFRPRREWHAVGSDALSFTEAHEFVAPGANRVVFEEVVQKPEDFRDDLLDGFEQAYRFFAARRDEMAGPDGWLSAFERCRARVMFRTSDQYAVVQDVLAAPRYQISGVARSAAMDILARPFAFDRARPSAWPITVEERQALEDLDIPHFTVGCGDTAVFAGPRPVGDHYFTRSGLEVARERWRNLSDEDLQFHLQWIVRSLSESVSSQFRVPLVLSTGGGDVAEAPAADNIELAAWIGHEHLHRAERTDAGLTWTFHPPGAIPAGAAVHCLYNGSLGPGVFLAALAHVTGERAWADAARLACAPVNRLVDHSSARTWSRDETLGIGTGLGSLVYSLHCVGRLLGDEAYVERAVRVATQIDAARIQEAQDLDVLAGVAGALLALLDLGTATGDRGPIEQAMICGDRLVASQIHTHWGSNWPTRDGRMLAGFAHGAAGVAYALARLYHATARRPYLEAALRAHRYERAVFSPVHRNWPLVRAAGFLPGNVAVPMTAWCHGAPGVGLARALVHDLLREDDPDVAGELDAAMQTTAGLQGGNVGDHLCCGNLGRCDVLFTAGLRLNAPALLDQAGAVATDVARKAAARGRFQLVAGGFEHVVFDPGFFHGLSGIGYQLLRLAAPSRLPSILAFEGIAHLGDEALPVPIMVRQARPEATPQRGA